MFTTSNSPGKKRSENPHVSSTNSCSFYHSSERIRRSSIIIISRGILMLNLEEMEDLWIIRAVF
jgi:hypothetical protein